MLKVKNTHATTIPSVDSIVTTTNHPTYILWICRSSINASTGGLSPEGKGNEIGTNRKHLEIKIPLDSRKSSM